MISGQARYDHFDKLPRSMFPLMVQLSVTLKLYHESGQLSTKDFK